MAVVPVTVVVTCRMAVVPAGTAPIVQIPVPALYEPWEAVALTNCRPTGNWSVTATLFAVSGPEFSRFNVKDVVCPTSTLGLLVVLASDRSADGWLLKSVVKVLDPIMRRADTWPSSAIVVVSTCNSIAPTLAKFAPLPPATVKSLASDSRRLCEVFTPSVTVAWEKLLASV